MKIDLKQTHQYIYHLSITDMPQQYLKFYIPFFPVPFILSLSWFSPIATLYISFSFFWGGMPGQKEHKPARNHLS